MAAPYTQGTTLSVANVRELPPLITPKDAAEILNVSAFHIRAMLRAGEIKGVKVGEVWRVNTAALLAQYGIA